MLDVEKEYKVLRNKLMRYKTKRLLFECGCITGYVTEIKLVQDPYFPSDKAIEVRGLAGFDTKERVLMTITNRWSKGKHYKYWKDYHILEHFPNNM